MTISSETYKVIYTGDGAVTEFDYTFRILSEDAIKVTKYTIADGTEVIKKIANLIYQKHNK